LFDAPGHGLNSASRPVDPRDVESVESGNGFVGHKDQVFPDPHDEIIQSLELWRYWLILLNLLAVLLHGDKCRGHFESPVNVEIEHRVTRRATAAVAERREGVPYVLESRCHVLEVSADGRVSGVGIAVGCGVLIGAWVRGVAVDGGGVGRARTFGLSKRTVSRSSTTSVAVATHEHAHASSGETGPRARHLRAVDDQGELIS
jgi:hypothetical protein